MATHRIPILGAGTIPDDSGEVWFEILSILGSNDVWKHLVARFQNSSTRDGLHGKFNVPKNYVDTANLIVVWSSTVITNDVEWDFDYRAVGGNDSESLDQAGNDESVNANDTAPSAAHERMEISIALTDSNFAADDTVQFTLFRDGTDAGDTLVGDVYLADLLFEYNDA